LKAEPWLSLLFRFDIIFQILIYRRRGFRFFEKKLGKKLALKEKQNYPIEPL
jgi:hypothetical protein